MLNLRLFQPADSDAVISLWQRCGLTRPWNNPARDIERKLAVQADGFLVGTDQDDAVIAVVMAGYDGHRGWLNYLAVDPACRRQGCGRQIVAAAEQWLHDQGCAKINLQIREDNVAAIAFYERLGFSVDQVISLGKRLESDQPS